MDPENELLSNPFTRQADRLDEEGLRRLCSEDQDEDEEQQQQQQTLLDVSSSPPQSSSSSSGGTLNVAPLPTQVEIYPSPTSL